MNNTELKNALNQGIIDLKLNISNEVQDKLIEYLFLLQKWNKIHNLTAITELNQMITHHLLDSLAIAPFINGNNILDVGSGAGLPGIPLALIFPQKKFTLLDSNNKKIRFLTYIIATLKLTNVTAEHVRAEKFHPITKFDCIVARAVGSLHAIISITRHLIKASGTLLVMKGKRPEHELVEIEPTLTVQTHTITVPNLGEQRHLISITGMNRSDSE
jgi:16S rRNA (guanine527-N7)-methyltransferase